MVTTYARAASGLLMREMSRRICLTEKVETDFGTCYAQIDIDGSGKVIGLNIAAHNKHEDSSVNKALNNLSQTFRNMLDEVNR